MFGITYNFKFQHFFFRKTKYSQNKLDVSDPNLNLERQKKLFKFFLRS